MALSLRALEKWKTVNFFFNMAHTGEMRNFNESLADQPPRLRVLSGPGMNSVLVMPCQN
jgi:hypothetical protein